MSDTTWSDRLAAAQTAARMAGKYLLNHSTGSITHKMDNDYVT